jgi:hypothetical protein
LARCFSGCLGGSSVLVDQSAEDSVASDRGVEIDHGGGIVAGRVLVEPLMRAVVIEMMFVLVQDGSGVSFVVDQQPVGALLRNRADDRSA